MIRPAEMIYRSNCLTGLMHYVMYVTSYDGWRCAWQKTWYL